MREEHNAPSWSRVVAGLIVLLVGVVFFLDNLDILEADQIFRFWPLALIAFGVGQLTGASRSKGVGIVAVALGTVFLARSLGWLTISIDKLWPLALVAGGLLLITNALRRRRPRAALGASDDGSLVRATAIVGAQEVTNSSAKFQGGEATVLMGGVNVDLRGATLEGPEAVLDVFAMWGGIEIHVPRDWQVEGKVLPLLGGFSDDTRRSSFATGQRLVVKGTVVMGGIVVNNGPEDEPKARRYEDDDE